MSIELQFGHDDTMALDNDRRAILERIGLFEVVGAYSRLAISGETQADSGTPIALLGCSASVAPSRAVRAVVCADLDVRLKGFGAISDYLVVELLVGGVAETAKATWQPTTVDERASVTRTWTIDLPANTTTTLELQASVASGATNAFVITDNSGMVIQLGIML